MGDFAPLIEQFLVVGLEPRSTRKWIVTEQCSLLWLSSQLTCSSAARKRGQGEFVPVVEAVHPPSATAVARAELFCFPDVGKCASQRHEQLRFAVHSPTKRCFLRADEFTQQNLEVYRKANTSSFVFLVRGVHKALRKASRARAADRRRRQTTVRLLSTHSADRGQCA